MSDHDKRAIIHAELVDALMDALQEHSVKNQLDSCHIMAAIADTAVCWYEFAVSKGLNRLEEKIEENPKFFGDEKAGLLSAAGLYRKDQILKMQMVVQTLHKFIVEKENRDDAKTSTTMFAMGKWSLN